MGFNLGGSMGGASQTQNTTASSTGDTSTKYSDGQQSIQEQLAGFFQKLFPSMASGEMSPDTKAATTATAGDINKNFQAAGDVAQKKLAQRGFGRSGDAEKATLQTELAREGALSANESAGAASQLTQNNQSLLAALNYAMTGQGSKTTSTGTENQKTDASKWGVSTGVGI